MTIRSTLSTSSWAPAGLMEPSEHGFILFAADSGTWRFPLALPSARRRKVLDQIRASALALRRDDRVLRADLFTALVRPPGGPGHQRAMAPRARFDAVLLAETSSPADAADLTAGSALTALAHTLDGHGRRVLTFAGRNARRIAPVDHERPGVFLFNYFSAPDVTTNLAVWEQTAGWFEQETGLDNSTVLQPVTAAGVPYAVVNHCRWDSVRDVLPALIFKMSFRRFVLRAFAEQHVTPEPLLYRQVPTGDPWPTHQEVER